MREGSDRAPATSGKQVWLTETIGLHGHWQYVQASELSQWLALAFHMPCTSPADSTTQYWRAA